MNKLSKILYSIVLLLHKQNNISRNYMLCMHFLTNVGWFAGHALITYVNDGKTPDN